MNTEKLISRVFQDKWQVEKVVGARPPVKGGSEPIVPFDVIVHDTGNPLIKYSARIYGIDSGYAENWEFVLGIPLSE